MGGARPTFSIVVATFNSADYIGRCISSLLNQNFIGFEVVVIDGASTDDTIRIVNQYNDSRIIVVSESDSGIYDAWNKGIKVSKGEWLLFLGSDDFLVDSTVLSAVKQQICLDHSTPALVSARLIVGERNGIKPVRETGIGWAPVGHILDCPTLNMPPHGSLFHSSGIFEGGHRFDASYQGSADKKLFFDVFWFCNIQYVDVLCTYFSLGGITNSTSNRLGRLIEVLRLRKDLKMRLLPTRLMRFFVSVIFREVCLWTNRILVIKTKSGQ